MTSSDLGRDDSECELGFIVLCQFFGEHLFEEVARHCDIESLFGERSPYMVSGRPVARGGASPWRVIRLDLLINKLSKRGFVHGYG